MLSEYINISKNKVKIFLYEPSTQQSLELSVTDGIPIKSSFIEYDELPDLEEIIISKEDFLTDYLAPSLQKLSEIKDAITNNLLPENNKNNQYFIDDDLDKVVYK